MQQLVVVANRLPVQRTVAADGAESWERSPGGLVAALEPAVASRTTAWVGWPGSANESGDLPDRQDGIALHPVDLTDADESAFYNGFANTTLWPLYHDAIVPSQFHRDWWHRYEQVNQKFADVAARIAEPGALIWVHDYQLQLVPQMIREQRDDVSVGFFLHIPFPAQELFLRIPWRCELMRGMLGADVVGFQTEVGAQNCRQIARRLFGWKVGGKTVVHEGGQTLVDCYPAGIDVAAVRRLSVAGSTVERARQIRVELGNPRTVLLGVDRLDYTKGIAVRLQAYRELLDERRVDPETTVLVQIAQPSRDHVPGYPEVRTEVERIVGGIQGDYGRMNGTVVKYLHQSQSFDELVALYRAADVMLVTPFRDGMNLVAKEYIAARLDNSGQLILSEFAGAAHELSQAMLVNPFDIDGLKTAIENAVKGDSVGSRRRMRFLARAIDRNDALHWSTAFLDALARTP